MLKFLAFLVVLFCHNGFVCAQLPENMLWQNFYGDNYENGPVELLQYKDSTLILAGYHYSLTTSEGVHSYPEAYQIDYKGKFVRHLSFKTSGDERFNWLTNVLVTPDYGFLVASTEVCYADEEAEKPDTHVMLQRFDSQGQLIWKKRYGNRCMGKLNGYQIINAVDDGFYLIGGFVADTTDGISPPNYGGMDGFLVRFDDLGNVLWSRNYGGTGYDYFERGIINTKGNLVLVGYSTSFDLDLEPNYTRRLGWVAEMDTMGNILSSSFFGGFKNGMSFSPLKIDKQDNVLIYGTMNNYSGEWLPGMMGGGDAFYTRYHPNGVIDTLKFYGGSDYDRFNDVLELSNGDLVFAGKTYSTDGNLTGFGVESSDGWLINVDSKGKVLDQNIFGKTWAEEIAAVIELSNKNLLCLAENGTGRQAYPEIYYEDCGKRPPDFWVFELSSISTGIQKNKLAAKNLLVYPNPASEVIRYKLPALTDKNCRITLLDVLGKVMFEENEPVGLEASISTSGLASGQYVLRVVGNQEIYSQRVTILK